MDCSIGIFIQLGKTLYKQETVKNRESLFIIKHKTAHTTMYTYCFKILNTISIAELTVLLSETAIFLKYCL